MTTPVHRLPYMLPGEPAYTLRAKWQAFAESVDTALVDRGIAPPEAVDLAALAGRVNALEESRWRRYRAHMAADWTYAGGDVFLNNFTTVQWDAGSATVNDTDRMFVADGAPIIKKGGLYRLRSRITLTGGTGGAEVVYRLCASNAASSAYVSHNAKLFPNETHLQLDVEVPLQGNARVYPLLWSNGGSPVVKTLFAAHRSYLDVTYLGPAPTNPTTR